MIEILLPDRTHRASAVACLRAVVDSSAGDENLVLHVGREALVLPQRVDPDQLHVSLRAADDLVVIAVRTDPPRCGHCLKPMVTRAGTPIR